MYKIFNKVAAVAVVFVFIAFGGSAVSAEQAKKADAKKAAAQKSEDKKAEQIESAEQIQKESQKIQTIFDFKKELKLTDDQEAKIKELLVALDGDVKILRAKLTIVDVEAQQLLANNGDLEKVKAKVKEAYDLLAQMRIADIESSRKINAVMTADQLKKWKEIQTAARTKK